MRSILCERSIWFLVTVQPSTLIRVATLNFRPFCRPKNVFDIFFFSFQSVANNLFRRSIGIFNFLHPFVHFFRGTSAFHNYKNHSESIEIDVFVTRKGYFRIYRVFLNLMLTFFIANSFTLEKYNFFKKTFLTP